MASQDVARCCGRTPAARRGNQTTRPAVTERELLEALSQLSRNTRDYFAAEDRQTIQPSHHCRSECVVHRPRIVTCRGYDTTPEVIRAVFRMPARESVCR